MILCKKTYELTGGLIFKKSKFYTIDNKNHTYDSDNIIDSYFIRTSENYGARFILNNYCGQLFPFSPKFSDYFFTESEVRNKKLKKLNKICQY
jgi:hypothetical protein